ncbi:MAG: RNA-binding transcriptional accessory protein [Candidatus Dactylopiibacterium carminicum]|uniref:RNA-binding transcriptional accessory protein n=1 Tax=Candidatus Dactylopiibacterium carminicum TaxID=857335 RepID=A0A272ERZ3_9RHOO|nr:Tex family protein [Candidatus Dactylopiibacterium carminicum]KAF7598949.1 RNA-binding transcriptional accessory protein [Candidatus Dactylopiibacterium carminicum]PAS92865.1 MAG: RNA-binding transcriptional accessory protein [Candidatus Dactylopiibacterium carminicum]PAS98967.1 MAG: RNA-binding transcriptional accessory protein [Candidatus Dactylopiibacterium carminicum]
MLPAIHERIATELAAQPRQVIAAIELLDGGATVPFIARYRKEVTGGLDDTQLRTLEERLGYLRELEERRTAVLASIEEQGKLTPPLRAEIENAESKQRLEDLYLPYKQKRRTKAQIAREAGIEPLADALLADPSLKPEEEAAKYFNVDAGFADAKEVLDGARQILMERFAENAELVGQLREYVGEHGVVRVSVAEGKENDSEAAKFRDYFTYSEKLGNIPSHRALALFRGRNEDVLRVKLALDSDPEDGSRSPEPNPCERKILVAAGIKDQGRAADKWLVDTARWTWSVKLALSMELDLMGKLRERAEEEAIRVFAQNLKALLLAAPAGAKTTMGLDPGIRTGVKVAVVDATGKLLDTATVYPHEPRRDWDGALHTLTGLIEKHGVQLIAIGNGTASRETDKLAGELIARLKQPSPPAPLPQGARGAITKIVVSEAGASVYSASELAAKEFPELDVSLRGAVSIARRLQDPLAELVKIEPKAIGVGQYQHDLNQGKLAKSLDAVVEDCVNAVGVDVNTASAALLTCISGLNTTLAQNIVAHRDANGAFSSRAALKKVPRLGDKTFEQCAGFLRINEGDNPLDRSAVHPEAYPVVEKILADVKLKARDLIGDSAVLKNLDARKYTDERFGLPTVQDILRELDKPGRDPRPEFKTASFREGVEAIKDLEAGMLLEGVVTNVTAFGAFVDIGVHQDGLVHVSALANRFIKDPAEVVKAGDIVKVKVVEVDLPRKRIALTMRLSDDVVRKPTGEAPRNNAQRGKPQQASRAEQAPAGSAFAAAFAKARQR